KAEDSTVSKLKRRSTVVRDKATGVFSKLKKILSRPAKAAEDKAAEAKPEAKAEDKAEPTTDSAVVAEAKETEAPKPAEAAAPAATATASA
ncbi:hypothetical protein H4S06_005968, partial [Coemansia sp. BCRC 34490]